MSDVNSTPTVREADESETILPATYVYRCTFMGQEHNYLCAVCREKPAVVETWHGVLQPCWVCQKNGWELYRRQSFVELILKVFKP